MQVTSPVLGWVGEGARLEVGQNVEGKDGVNVDTPSL